MAVGDYSLNPFTLPIAPNPVAMQVRNNDNLLRAKFVAHQMDKVAHHTFGLDANKPTPAEAGMVYIATDTGLIWFYTGAAWQSILAFRQYGAWSDTNDQFAAVVNTGYVLTFNTVDVADGVSLVSNSRITVPNTGVYNLQWSGQFINTDSAEHDVDVWLRLNGTDIVGSRGSISVPKRHGSIDGHILPAWNYFLNLNANDYIQLVWSVSDLAVSLKYDAATAYGPSTASIIASINRV